MPKGDNNRHSKKTHCDNGHEYTPENLRYRFDNVSENPSRVCKKCERERRQRSRQLKKQLIASIQVQEQDN